MVPSQSHPQDTDWFAPTALREYDLKLHDYNYPVSFERLPMATALNVAKYFLTLSEPDEGNTISFLKLQKLAYYAQGCHLALYGKPLFEDPIERWTQGPVLPSLHQEYTHEDVSELPIPLDFTAQECLTGAECKFLNEIWDTYGQYSAWKLHHMTREEPPVKGTPLNTVISHEVLSRFFSTLVEEDDLPAEGDLPGDRL